jgi:hypothetical protein
VAYVALLDASVLHPWVVCDLLLRLAERGLYRLGMIVSSGPTVITRFGPTPDRLVTC